MGGSCGVGGLGEQGSTAGEEDSPGRSVRPR